MRPRASLTGLASALIAAAVAAFYLLLLVQGDLGPGGLRLEVGSMLWATLLCLLPLVVGAGSIAPPSSKGRWLLGGGAAGLTLIGVLALFSIGAPLLLSAVLAWVALLTRR